MLSTVKVINNGIFDGFIGKVIEEDGSKVLVEVNDGLGSKFSIHIPNSNIEIISTSI